MKKNLEEEYMSDLLVVKTNQLNEAMHNLTQQEMQLMGLAIVIFRENPTFEDLGIVKITAKQYQQVFKVNRVTAHQSLLEAEKNLFKRQFTIELDNGNTLKTRWISHVEYLKGENAIKVGLSPIIVQHISRIDPAQNPYTKYHLEQIGKFNSRYATRLYELVKQWLLVKKTPIFKLEKFRFQMGLLPKEYSRMSNFKAKVLDVATKEINQKSDISLSYKSIKDGRNIIGYQFFIKEKSEKGVVLDGECRIIEKKLLSKKQSDFFASKIAKDSDFGSKYARQGEDMPPFIERISHELQTDIAAVNLYMPYLIRYEYKPNRTKIF